MPDSTPSSGTDSLGAQGMKGSSYQAPPSVQHASDQSSAPAGRRQTEYFRSVDERDQWGGGSACGRLDPSAQMDQAR